MGIFGAMTTAVAGLQAQSFALENISGNISNSQTTAFKRVDTSFADIVMSMGQSSSRQSSGSVLASARATNTLQGPVSASSIDTHMAITGDGYFQIQRKVGESDGEAQFSGANLYTRRGDFVMDKEGYLVNGAGGYLMGIPIDPGTGNPVGDVAQLMKLSTGLIEARASTKIDYAANLPKQPRTGLLDITDYTQNPALNAASPATAPSLTGSLAYTDIDLSASASDSFTFDVNGTTVTLGPSDGTAGVISIGEAVTAISAQLPAGISVAQGTGADAGKLVFSSTSTGSSASITVDNIVATGTNTVAADLGFGTSATASGTDAVPAGTGVVIASDFATFQSQSREGGSTTVYDAAGTPADVQFRWAKMDDSPATWNLFYQSNSEATGSQTMWTNVGTDFVFNSTGKLTSPTTGEVTIPNMSINGNSMGSITFDFGTNGLTQYASSQGDVDVTLTDQDGYASGSLISVGVGDNGRITANYTNGQQIDVAEVPLYQFNGDSALKREDGGAFSVTRESGSPVKMNEVSITGQALEGSNTDIAEEFSKMIITQQAYSANSRIITTANDMMQDVLNIVR
ncbi:flagellar hook protein FlgE [Prosthecomicrobium hirschii]|uniref:flagellar hook protein FlgE n=1 Tax=Prosthecodimorpha hirschii TaxID=665126 RepID=UPI002220B2D7|nr:flagellar hook-basal body complex protein [Prosthecomicrobium hirschii]MCW1843952.1 flagellar hook-basal body complex protein [Prosthecomicrobium hirschii]